MSTKQPDALRLADALASNYFDGKQGREVWDSAAAELRRLHADLAHADRYAEQLGRELAKAVAEIADLEAQLASIGAGYTAADMATAAAQGFRDGAASLAASAGSEPVAHLWQHSETGRTRVVMPDMVVDASATWLPVGPLYLHPSPSEGMAMVPKVPTEAMVDAFENAMESASMYVRNFRVAYRAMIAAAPLLASEAKGAT